MNGFWCDICNTVVDEVWIIDDGFGEDDQLTMCLKCHSNYYMPVKPLEV